MSKTLIELQALGKVYNPGQPTEVSVLKGLDLSLAHGEFAALIGPSGSGKSTLLNVLGLLERPSSGQYLLDGRAVQDLDDKALTQARQATLGFVFQFHHLLPAFTALENVCLPGLARDGHVSPALRERGRALLAAVGLASAMDRPSKQLSGGMQQRVAIARALVHRPALVLADEPTGNLDPRHAAQVLELLRTQCRQEGAACLLVTHSERAAVSADRCLRMDAEGLQPWSPSPH